MAFFFALEIFKFSKIIISFDASVKENESNDRNFDKFAFGTL